MHLATELRERKLATLIAAEGCASLEDLCQAVIGDSVSPAICTQPDCSFTCTMEPDQEAGFCEACGRDTVVSALVLAGLI